MTTAEGRPKKGPKGKVIWEYKRHELTHSFFLVILSSQMQIVFVSSHAVTFHPLSSCSPSCSPSRNWVTLISLTGKCKKVEEIAALRGTTKEWKRKEWIKETENIYPGLVYDLRVLLFKSLLTSIPGMIFFEGSSSLRRHKPCVHTAVPGDQLSKSVFQNEVRMKRGHK